ncbi:MAG: hypothetical protein N4A35_03220 [Flavobacteriales bacterium]|jgi:hypothetical protein|nr:hypothetical protein [Flavobacteriales bacterium]
MIGLLIIFYAGNLLYKLADKYDKNKWGYAILGVVTYYLGTFIFGVIMLLISTLSNGDVFFGIPDLVVNLLSIPFGALLLWLLHRFLEKKWSESVHSGEISELLDENLEL